MYPKPFLDHLVPPLRIQRSSNSQEQPLPLEKISSSCFFSMKEKRGEKRGLVGYRTYSFLPFSRLDATEPLDSKRS